MGRGGPGRGQNPTALPGIFSGSNSMDLTNETLGKTFHSNEFPEPSRVAMLAESLGDHFKLFIPDTLVQSCVTETNRYARQSTIVKPSTMKWSDVNFGEILAYLGMPIALALVNLPCILYCFSTEPISAHPWFP